MKTTSLQFILRVALGFLLVPEIAHALEVELISESVRVDLETGRILESSRYDGPKSPEQYRLPSPVSLVAAKDEVIAFQAIVRGAPGTYSATVTFAKPGLSPTVFYARAVHVKEPSVEGYVRSLGAGAYPDVLIESSTVAITKRHAAVWVDVWVPKEAPAGRYAGNLEIGGTKTPFDIEVLDVMMPTEDVARLGAVNFGSYLTRGKRDPSALKAWLQLGHAHHFSVEFLRSRPKSDASGRIDWEGWGDRMAPLFEGTMFTPAEGYRGPRQGESITRFVLPHTDWWPDVETKDRLPSNPARWSASLKEFEDLALRRRWFKRPNPTEFVVFVNSLDEPKTEAAFQSLAAYKKLMDDARLADRRHVRFRVDGPMRQLESWPDKRVFAEIGPVADVWNVCGATYWSPWASLQARQAAHPDEQILFYGSNTAGEPATPPVVVDAPITGPRAWGWIVHRYGLGGALNWEVDYKAGCAANPDCVGDGLNLDATLIFRGHEVGRGYDEPVPSMRLKALRRGAQDVALLRLLEKKDPDAARQISELIVPYAMGDAQPHEGPGPWPSRPDVYERVRTEVLSRLAGRPAKATATLRDRESEIPLWRRKLGRTLVAVGIAVIVGVMLRLRKKRG